MFKSIAILSNCDVSENILLQMTTDPGVPGSIPGHYKKKVVGLERGPLSLVSTTEELLDKKIAAPV
jgi:hypothetical protein